MVGVLAIPRTYQIGLIGSFAHTFDLNQKIWQKFNYFPIARFILVILVNCNNFHRAIISNSFALEIFAKSSLDVNTNDR